MANYEIIGTNYQPLGIGLLRLMTDAQRKRVCYYDKNTNKYYASLKSIVKCFSFVGEEEAEKDIEEQCVCGVRIKYLFRVANRETNDCSAIIGSECIKHGFDDADGFHNAPIPCSYCGAWLKSGKDHKACERKMQFQTTIVHAVLQGWRTLAKKNKKLVEKVISKWKSIMYNKRILMYKCKSKWLEKLESFRDRKYGIKFPCFKYEDQRVMTVWATDPQYVIWFYNNVIRINQETNCYRLDKIRSCYEKELKELKEYVKQNIIQDQKRT